MSQRVELRLGAATDAPAIRELTREAYAKWIPRVGREPKPMTADYGKAVIEHRFDLIFVGGKLAALVETIPQTDHLLIENVAVLPSFQGRGFGRTLMHHVEEVAASLGLSEIKLYTNELFTENLQFYKKIGYHADRVEEFAGGVAVHMSKSVRDSNNRDRASIEAAAPAQSIATGVFLEKLI